MPIKDKEEQKKVVITSMRNIAWLHRELAYMQNNLPVDEIIQVYDDYIQFVDSKKNQLTDKFYFNNSNFRKQFNKEYNARKIK